MCLPHFFKIKKKKWRWDGLPVFFMKKSFSKICFSVRKSFNVLQNYVTVINYRPTVKDGVNFRFINEMKLKYFYEDFTTVI